MRRFIKFPKKRGSKNRQIKWSRAGDVKKRGLDLIDKLTLDWIEKDKLLFFRSENSSSRAVARIWGLPRIWREALNLNPAYILEVISEKFDRLSQKDQDAVLLHELNHIPRNFSGSLLGHTRKGKRNFHEKLGTLISRYRKLQ